MIPTDVDSAWRVRELMLALVAGGPWTALAVALAEGIAEDGAFRPPSALWRYAIAVGERRAEAGRVGGRVLRAVGRGLSPAQALAELALPERLLVADAGPLLRVGPLAALRALDRRALDAAALTEAALTNPHPIPGDIALALTRLLRALLEGVEWASALEQARAGRLDDTRRALSPSRFMTLDTEGSALAMLRCAVFFVDQTRSVDGALRDSRAFAPDAAAHLALTHLIAAARFGSAGPLNLSPEERARGEQLGRFFAADWSA